MTAVERGTVPSGQHVAVEHSAASHHAEARRALNRDHHRARTELRSEGAEHRLIPEIETGAIDAAADGCIRRRFRAPRDGEQHRAGRLESHRSASALHGDASPFDRDAIGGVEREIQSEAAAGISRTARESPEKADRCRSVGS